MVLTASAGTLQPALIGEARHALGRALVHLLETRQGGGYWEAPADARILDTAVVAHALSADRGDRASREACDHVRNWLLTAPPQCHDPVAHDIDCWLRALATNRHDQPPPVPYVSAWKYGGRALLVQTLGVSAGAPGANAAELLETVGAATRSAEGRRLKQWQRINLIAAELIARAKLDVPVPGRLVAALESEQDPAGSFCRMPAVTGIAYRALRLIDDDSPAGRRSLRWLLESQRPDGTWGFVSNDVWDTSLTVRSFRGTPLFDHSALEPALDFVERAQNPDGGWSFRRGLESDNDSAGAALLALAGTPQGQRAWSAAQAYACRTQLPSGPWTTWQSADDTPAVDATAHMVAGLSAFGFPVVDTCRAKAWLASRYDEDAPWKMDWYSPLGYAVHEVASAIGWSHPRTLDSVMFLVEHQCPDGGWPTVDGETCPAPAATGLALSAIAHSGVIVPSETIASAVTFIIDSQRDDGSWAGAPMMLGPRPFLVHFPTHTHAFVGAGLRDLLQHL